MQGIENWNRWIEWKILEIMDERHESILEIIEAWFKNKLFKEIQSFFRLPTQIQHVSIPHLPEGGDQEITLLSKKKKISRIEEMKPKVELKQEFLTKFEIKKRELIIQFKK